MKGVTVSTGGDKAENEVRGGVFSERRPAMLRRRMRVVLRMRDLNLIVEYSLPQWC